MEEGVPIESKMISKRIKGARAVILNPAADPVQKKQALLAATAAAGPATAKLTRCSARSRRPSRARDGPGSADLALVGSAVSRAKHEGLATVQAAMERATDHINAATTRRPRPISKKFYEPLAAGLARNGGRHPSPTAGGCRGQCRGATPATGQRTAHLERPAPHCGGQPRSSRAGGASPDGGRQSSQGHLRIKSWKLLGDHAEATPPIGRATRNTIWRAIARSLKKCSPTSRRRKTQVVVGTTPT